jgi:hypothetical protein
MFIVAAVHEVHFQADAIQRTVEQPQGRTRNSTTVILLLLLSSTPASCEILTIVAAEAFATQLTHDTASLLLQRNGV